VFAASGLYTHVVTGHCQGRALATARHHFGIINSITKLHLVGISTEWHSMPR